MKQFVIVAVFSLVIAVSAVAETTKRGYAACLTKDLFEQYRNALIKKDYYTIGYLVENGCLIPKAGIRITVLDRTWRGQARIRAYGDGDSIVLWTNVENIVP